MLHRYKSIASIISTGIMNRASMYATLVPKVDVSLVEKTNVMISVPRPKIHKTKKVQLFTVIYKCKAFILRPR